MVNDLKSIPSDSGRILGESLRLQVLGNYILELNRVIEKLPAVYHELLGNYNADLYSFLNVKLQRSYTSQEFVSEVSFDIQILLLPLLKGISSNTKDPISTVIIDYLNTYFLDKGKLEMLYSLYSDVRMRVRLPADVEMLSSEIVGKVIEIIGNNSR